MAGSPPSHRAFRAAEVGAEMRLVKDLRAGCGQLRGGSHDAGGQRSDASNEPSDCYSDPVIPPIPLASFGRSLRSNRLRPGSLPAPVSHRGLDQSPQPPHECVSQLDRRSAEKVQPDRRFARLRNLTAVLKNCVVGPV
jgi:hypothetical protein